MGAKKTLIKRARAEAPVSILRKSARKSAQFARTCRNLHDPQRGLPLESVGLAGGSRVVRPLLAERGDTMT